MGNSNSKPEPSADIIKGSEIGQPGSPNDKASQNAIPRLGPLDTFILSLMFFSLITLFDSRSADGLDRIADALMAQESLDDNEVAKLVAR
tara:strand:+ start:139 stop:408 length:270 start_codon:yes stop_codon:yes gene_type:complete